MLGKPDENSVLMDIDCEDFIKEVEREFPTKVAASNDYSRLSLSRKDLLALYYSKVFPVKSLVRWLSYGNERQYLMCREFSFTLDNDIYVRYITTENAAMLAKKLQKDVPVKIDIGAIYSSKPSERKSIAALNFRPIEHELVFDIDMTDYDDVRTCCQGKSVCDKCWKFIAVAVKILDTACREDFGFDDILWVFSGRRGVHGWISDHRARCLQPSARKSLISYLELIKSSSDGRRKANLSDNPSVMVERSLEIAREYFSIVALGDQDFISSQAARSKFISLLPDEKLKNALGKLWSNLYDKAPSLGAADYWKAFEQLLQNFTFDGHGSNFSRLIDEIQLRYLYPRLDANVSVQLNHLLKSPFCIHPDTGKLCIPIDPTMIDSFDPGKVPTIASLIDDQGQFSPDYDRIMEPYFYIFDSFLRKIENRRSEAMAEMRAVGEKNMDF